MQERFLGRLIQQARIKARDEGFTDKVMERIKGEKIRAREERIVSKDELPNIFEAAKLEKGVFIELYKPKGIMIEEVSEDAIAAIKVPEGSVIVRIHSLKPNLTTFWNTFDALCEYDKPVVYLEE